MRSGWRIKGLAPYVGSLAAIGLIATGCGGSSDTADESSSPTAASTTTAPTSSAAEPSQSLSPPETVTPTPSATELGAPPTSVSPTDPSGPGSTAVPVAVGGFPEGTSYWTFADTPGSPYAFAAYGARYGDSMCLIKFYPEYVVEVGTLTATAAGQEFAIAAREETMLNPYVPPYTAIVTGDPAIAVVLSSTYGDLMFNRVDVGTAASTIEASNPGTDGLEALARITGACG